MTVLLAAMRLLGNTGAVHNAATAVQANRRDQLLVEALLRRLPGDAGPAPAPASVPAPAAAAAPLAA